MASTTPDTQHTTEREGRFEHASEPPTTASPVERHAAPTADTTGRSGKATASFILGIVGVLAALLIPIVGIVVGIVAAVLGRASRKEAAARGNGWMATAGMVLGIVGAVLALANMVLAAAIITSNS